ncbi:MAG TPA: ammonium transporter [Acidimicrobiia bacterium]|jgi:ammonium transporter, Amt family|nr:ammonium transporter [Acidimicrobiia bacterium]
MRINAGDTAWVLASAALVMFMTPGLALFYGGMVRAKNVLAMLMQNFFCLGLISVLWAVCMYSLAFHGTGKWIGDLDLAFLHHANVVPATGFGQVPIPPLSFSAFQLMFAVITPALITGAIADRMKFSAWFWFVGLWALVVYTPVAHWVFSPAGWLFRRGALDFAGGTVVHINAGIAALAAVLVLGRRRGWPEHPSPPHSLPLTLLGTGILWFGWFGFNAGSALAANGIAAQALINTHMAAAAALLSWLLFERLRGGHATTLGAASGAVAGLVAITPCAGFVGGMAAIWIGLIAGALCYFAVSVKFRFGYDDALDVVGVHLVGGLAGSLLLGLFADRAFNPAVVHQGVFVNGSWELMGDQLVAVGATLVWSGVLTFVILKVLQLVIPGGLRVSEDDEETGLDLTQHSEVGYSLDRV